MHLHLENGLQLTGSSAGLAKQYVKLARLLEPGRSRMGIHINLSLVFKLPYTTILVGI
jgi:hypothetical protein